MRNKIELSGLILEKRILMELYFSHKIEININSQKRIAVKLYVNYIKISSEQKT